jgi:asparagine synthase (glutamine-hydrolysing)
MCGFAALTGGGACAPGLIEAGVRAIRHRGPDGEGIWRALDGRAALGHARLAIQDLSSSGAQPMVSADGRAVLAYNGEIYNASELAEQISVPLRSRSDTEVLLELLRKKGLDALSQVRGMFAFAYWDGEELWLVRDRLGIKPLFYAEAGDGLAAASEIAAVLALRSSAPAIDGRSVDDFLTYLYVPPPRTGIAGVHELPPAHALRWSARRGTSVQRYWRAPSAAPASFARPAAVREILADSVRAHLVSDVPVGVFLSGGLDSSSIVALAARAYPGVLKTFTVTFADEGRHLDERGFAREVAARYGTDHREIEVRADVARILPELVAHFGQPFGNPTAVLTYALSRATREHVKVALAGDGGDEVLGGYPRYQGAWLAQLVRRVPETVRRPLARSVAGMMANAPRGFPANRLKRFLEASSDPVDGMYYRWVTYADEPRKATLLADRDALVGADAAREPYEFLAAARNRVAARPMHDAAALVDVESFLPCNVLAYGDRMSMAHALEVRVPFCDHVVVEKLAPQPLSLKMPGGAQKGLLRWAMRRDLPPRVSLHRKVGFNPPIAAWLGTDLARIVDEYASEHAVRRRAVFAWRAVQDLVDRFRAGDGSAAYVLWSVVVVEAWMRWLDALDRPGERP